MSSYAICCLSVIGSSLQVNTPLITECFHRWRCNQGANAYECTHIRPHTMRSASVQAIIFVKRLQAPQRALPVWSFDHQGRYNELHVDGSQVCHPLHVRLLAWLIPTTLVHTLIPSLPHSTSYGPTTTLIDSMIAGGTLWPIQTAIKAINQAHP